MSLRLGMKEAEEYCDSHAVLKLHADVQDCLRAHFANGFYFDQTPVDSSIDLHSYIKKIRAAVDQDPMQRANLYRMIEQSHVDAMTRSLKAAAPYARQQWEMQALHALTQECATQASAPYLQKHMRGLANEEEQAELDAGVKTDVFPELIALYRNYLSSFISEERIADAMKLGEDTGITAARAAVEYRLKSLPENDADRQEYEAAHVAVIDDATPVLGKVAISFAKHFEDRTASFGERLTRRAHIMDGKVDEDDLACIAKCTPRER